MFESTDGVQGINQLVGVGVQEIEKARSFGREMFLQDGTEVILVALEMARLTALEVVAYTNRLFFKLNYR